jgi:hypothetical protein
LTVVKLPSNWTLQNVVLNVVRPCICGAQSIEGDKDEKNAKSEGGEKDAKSGESEKDAKNAKSGGGEKDAKSGVGDKSGAGAKGGCVPVASAKTGKAKDGGGETPKASAQKTEPGVEGAAGKKG